MAVVEKADAGQRAEAIPPLGYKPELDGVRAIAVLAVMAFHVANALPIGLRLYGGLQGVDVFFVLSGYLITTLFLREFARTGTFDLPRFYGRRAVRLLPALGLAVLLVAAITTYLGKTLVHHSMLGLALIAFSFVGNWFQSTGSLGLLTHTWSLAIEEQFYLLWPVILLLILRTKRSKPRVIGCMVALAVGVMIARMALIAGGKGALGSYATFSRSDGIILGSALALFLPRVTPAVKRFLAAGAVGIASAIALGAFMAGCGHGLSPTMCYAPGGSILSTVLIAHLVVAPTGVLATVLAIKPLRAIGRISYGLYLFHVPLAGWALLWHRPALVAPFVFIGAFAIATASYFLVERPMIRHFSPGRRPQVQAIPIDSPRLAPA
jgi:peptidoglycan/LPS O-acetylase OafA/YrhL